VVTRTVPALPPLPPVPAMPQAACRGLPAFTDDATSGADVALRRRLCSRCPERETCLDVALRTHPRFDAGVWGGTTRRQRSTLRAARGITFAPYTNPDRSFAGLLDAAFRGGRRPASAARRRGAA
jgi:hypothetical protein